MTEDVLYFAVLFTSLTGCSQTLNVIKELEGDCHLCNSFYNW